MSPLNKPLAVSLPPPLYLPIGGEAGQRIPYGLPEEIALELFQLTAGLPVVLENNDTSDPLTVYEVQIGVAYHSSASLPPTGPYAVYILRGGRIKTRLIDEQVNPTTDGLTRFPLVRTAPFVEMPWTINRHEQLIFVWGLTGNDLDKTMKDATASPGAPVPACGIIIKRIVRR